MPNSPSTQKAEKNSDFEDKLIMDPISTHTHKDRGTLTTQRACTTSAKITARILSVLQRPRDRPHQPHALPALTILEQIALLWGSQLEGSAPRN